MSEKNKTQGVALNKEVENNDNKATESKGFLNPFTEGVTYATFLEKIGKKTISEYCKGHLTDEEVLFIEKEVEQYLNTNK